MEHARSSTATRVAIRFRHGAIVDVLERNVMPPAAGDGAPGIADSRVRAQLIALAKTFAQCGDIAFDREPAQR